MRSPSIEWLYGKLDNHIKLTSAYTEIKELDFIIRACRLKPYEYIFKGRNKDLILHRWWFDEFGNSLKIEKKNINIIYNDLNLDQEKLVCTDLYYGLSIKQISKISKLFYLIAGKDEDLLQDCFIISFLGIDNHLRSYLYLYGEWQQISSLLLGISHLKNIAKHLDLDNFQQFKFKKISMPCLAGEAWLSFWPSNQDFINLLNKKYETIIEIIR